MEAITAPGSQSCLPAVPQMRVVIPGRGSLVPPNKDPPPQAGRSPHQVWAPRDAKQLAFLLDFYKGSLQGAISGQMFPANQMLAEVPPSKSRLKTSRRASCFSEQMGVVCFPSEHMLFCSQCFGNFQMDAQPLPSFDSPARRCSCARPSSRSSVVCVISTPPLLVHRTPQRRKNCRCTFLASSTSPPRSTRLLRREGACACLR